MKIKRIKNPDLGTWFLYFFVGQVLLVVSVLRDGGVSLFLSIVGFVFTVAAYFELFKIEK